MNVNHDVPKLEGTTREHFMKLQEEIRRYHSKGNNMLSIGSYMEMPLQREVTAWVITSLKGSRRHYDVEKWFNWSVNFFYHVMKGYMKSSQSYLRATLRLSSTRCVARVTAFWRGTAVTTRRRLALSVSEWAFASTLTKSSEGNECR